MIPELVTAKETMECDESAWMSRVKVPRGSLEIGIKYLVENISRFRPKSFKLNFRY